MVGRFLALALAVAAPSFSVGAGPNGPALPNGVHPDTFLTDLWPDAQRQGITRATFDQAFAGFTPDPRIIAATRREPEYGKPIGAYLDGMVSPRIASGIAKSAQWADVFDAIEKAYGVDRWIILAIWGVETSYGGVKDRWDVIRSLATLAHAQYRHPYFRNELLVALKILQEGHIARDRMLGSWAGAMGQPQFMPRNFFAYAVDFSGDGRRDIWTNVPDVLASIANYLKKEGWQSGLRWGFEVVVPKDFDYRRSRGSFAEWAALGVRRADGGAYPTGDAVLLFPSGASGPAFLVTKNFSVIKLYNNSDAYALAVAHLADRVHGGGPIRTPWPAEDPQLSRDARVALQRKMASLGYQVRDLHGRIDFELRDAIREVQSKFGMVADGHPTPVLLQRLGVEVR